MARIQFENKTWEIPDRNSACSAWQVYHKELKQAFGKDHARTIWLVTWQHEGSSSCLAGNAFNTWQKKAGLDVGNTAFDLLNGVTEFTTGLWGLGASLTKVVKYGLPVALGGIFLLLIISAMRSKGQGSLPAAALNLLPAGRALNLAKSFAS